MDTADRFDAYHKWLGIPPAEQPPTLYRLLGINPAEADVDVIHAAADRQTGFLRTVQAGPHADEANHLLNAIAAARICLTNPQQKANYDAVIQSATPAETADPNAAPVTKQDQNASRSGKAFGPFDVLELIKKSQFGNVYKACHRDSGRLVSLKVLPVDAAKNNEILRRFEREQKVNLTLTHPNLITGYAAGVEGGRHYLVTEHVVGTDLATLVSQRGPLSVDEAVNYILQAARGLTQLHMNGVYHRNIKPHILYVDMQGQIKVTCMFLARLDEFTSIGGEEEDLTTMGQTMGTAEYMSPEQAINAKEVDGRADIYALGCTLYFILAGRPPYGGKSLMDKLLAHRNNPIPPLSALRNDIPEHVELTYQRMMAKDVNARFQFMGDVVEAMEIKPKVSLMQKLFGWFSGK